MSHSQWERSGIEADLLQFDRVGNVDLMSTNNDIICLCGNIDGNLKIQDNNGLTITDTININATTGSNVIRSNSPLIINSDVNSATDLTLIAGNDSGAVGDDLIVRNNAVVTINSAINRTMTVQAGDQVILGDASGGGSTGTLRTIGGGTHNIVIEADRDGDADGVNGSVFQAFGTQDAIITDALSITAGDGIGVGGTTSSGGGSTELKLQLIGQAGSNVINYVASGSVTVGNATLNTNSSLGLAPNSGVWTSSYDNNLGDILSNTMNTSLNDDLALSNGGVSYRLNGTQFGVLDLLDLDGSTSAGDDDVELDTAGVISYPSLTVGDVLSWVGSGTFTLEDSETFDSLFVATGTFSNAIDGGNYVVEVIDSATQSSGLLMTSVSSMTLAIDGPDGINIENQKSGAELVINGITDAGGGGNVSVSNSSPLTVSGDVTVAGNLTLTAGNDAGSPGDDLTIANDATITIDSAVDGKVLTLMAGDNIVFGDSGGASTGTVQTINGNHSIVVTAGDDGNGDGVDGSVIQDFGTNPALVTDQLIVNSGGSIGDSGGLSLTINVNDLSASAVTDIAISETDGVELVDIDTFDGSIDIEAGGNLVATDVVTGDVGNDESHGIDLSTTGGGTLTIGTLTSDSDVILNASGSILDDGNAATKITADMLTADAGGGIDLDTFVNSIDASTSAAGNITISEMDGVDLVDIDTFDGNVDIDAAGNLVATDVATGDDSDDEDHGIDLSTTAGGTLTVGTLNSDSDVILNASGSILNDGNAGTKITAGMLTADAGGGIDLDTFVNNIDASTSAAGNINIQEMDGVKLLDIDTFDGGIDISAGGDLVATDVVSGDNNSDDSNGIEIQTTSGNIRLDMIDSDHDLRINAANDLFDLPGAQIMVGRNFVIDAGRTIKLGDNATDSIDVTGLFSVRTLASSDGARIRVGVSNDGGLPRGTDSGANVLAPKIRFRSANSVFTNVGNTSINLDSAVKVVASNNVTSLMLRSEGAVTDDANATIRVKNSATFMATDGVDFFDIQLGDSFGTNEVKFRSLSLVGKDVSIERDGRVLLDGVKVTGNLTLGTTQDIRQTGLDRFGAIGTPFVEVAGETELVFDNTNPAGGDARLVSNQQNLLMDNLFDGKITITTTGFTGQRNGTGSVRDVDIRNSSTNPIDLNYQFAAADQLRNLLIWTPNSSFEFGQNVESEQNVKAFVGVDSDSIDGATGFRVRGGTMVITDAGSDRSLTDVQGFGLVSNDATFIVANSILLGDDATDSLEVTDLSSFTILQDAADSSIQVGVDPNATRGTDSGALYTTDRLRFRAPVGDHGLVTILVDSDFTILPESNAGDALVEKS